MEVFIQVGDYDAAREAMALADQLVPPPTQGTDLRRLMLAFAIGEDAEIREKLETYAIADRATTDLVESVLSALDLPRDELFRFLENKLDGAEDFAAEAYVVMASVAAHFGNPELALTMMEKELSINMVRSSRLWYPHFSEMRSLPGFKRLAARIGLVEYWRAYGWADTCRPLSGDDFECA